jgi:hypothetical protein
LFFSKKDCSVLWLSVLTLLALVPPPLSLVLAPLVSSPPPLVSAPPPLFKILFTKLPPSVNAPLKSKPPFSPLNRLPSALVFFASPLSDFNFALLLRFSTLLAAFSLRLTILSSLRVFFRVLRSVLRVLPLPLIVGKSG